MTLAARPDGADRRLAARPPPASSASKRSFGWRARASTWDALVAERVPAATGACRLIAIESDALLVEADQPIVAQELRLRTGELLGAFRTAPGGFPATGLRVRVRRV